MQKVCTLFPLSDLVDDDCTCDFCQEDDDGDDGYGDIQLDYVDQFSLPFMSKHCKSIDLELPEKVTIELVIQDQRGLVLGTMTCHPTPENYLGPKDQEFSDLLFSFSHQPIDVFVKVC